MTQSTFQELLTSQEARNECDVFWVKSGPNEGKFYLTQSGELRTVGEREDKFITNAIWQGWLTEAAPPPEPRVFYRVEYRPVFKVEGLYFGGFATKSEAQAFGKAAGGMVACVRVEITAVEGQYDD